MSYTYQPYVVPSCVAYDNSSYSIRAVETFRRRQFMEGGWPILLAGAMGVLLSAQAAKSMPCIDASRNLFRDTIMRLSARYSTPPTVKEGDLGTLDAQMLFSEHPTIEQFTLAYGACPVLVRAYDGNILIDAYPPDHCDVEWSPSGQIVKLRLARPIAQRAGGWDFACEEWDISDSAKPVYSVLRDGRFIPTSSYPWRFSEGAPFIPVVLFRAQKTPDWWGSCRWPELIEATLEEGIAWTIHRYGRLNSSNGIPYVLDAHAVGLTSDGEDANSSLVDTGPNFLLQLHSASGKTGNCGVLQPAFDPEKDVQAITAAFNSRMASLGLGDTAIQRGSPESGLAITLRREGLLRLRQSSEPTFRMADREYLRKAVAVNRIFNRGVPESPVYRLEYAPLPMGNAENKEMRDQEAHDLAIGVATPADILARREGISVEDAQKKIVEKSIVGT